MLNRFIKTSVILTIGFHSILAISNSSAQETNWTLSDGSEFEASFTINLGGKAFFHNREGQYWSIPTHLLDEDSKQRIQEYGDKGREPIYWNESDSILGTTTTKKSLILDENSKLTSFSPLDRIEPEFYVFYVGASWCGPCRRFVQSLKVSYEQYKKHGINNFEVFFVSHDSNRGAFKKYVFSLEMPWPSLNWTKKYPKIIRKFERDSVPGMVIADRDGNILSDAHNGKEYRGAYEVLNDLDELILRTNPDNPYSRLRRFNGYLNRYLHNLKEANADPKPVYTYIEPKLQEKWNGLKATIALVVSENGHVIDIQVEDINKPELSDEVKNSLYYWKFFPKVTDHHAVQSSVRLPLVVQIPE